MSQIRLDAANLGPYLQELGLISHASAVSVESAGDGNINWVRRCSLPGGSSWVVKQARQALEAFPEYSASTERIAFEARFYERTARFDRDGICPHVEHFDPNACVLVLEDLCELERMDSALARGADVTEPACRVAAFLGRVHVGSADASWAPLFENDEMRKLHGDHIFHLPYRDNDFPLSPAIAKRARTLRNNANLVAIIDAAHAQYLDPGDRGALIHADAQPTNILLGQRGPKLLDAEIAHIGDPAFDIGVLVAHLLLASIAGVVRPDFSHIWAAYREAWSDRDGPNLRDVVRYAGVELLRRTLGAARAPGVEHDACALAVIERGCDLVEFPLDAVDRL